MNLWSYTFVVPSYTRCCILSIRNKVKMNYFQVNTALLTLGEQVVIVPTCKMFNSLSIWLRLDFSQVKNLKSWVHFTILTLSLVSFLWEAGHFDTKVILRNVILRQWNSGALTGYKEVWVSLHDFSCADELEHSRPRTLGSSQDNLVSRDFALLIKFDISEMEFCYQLATYVNGLRKWDCRNAVDTGRKNKVYVNCIQNKAKLCWESLCFRDFKRDVCIQSRAA